MFDWCYVAEIRGRSFAKAIAMRTAVPIDLYCYADIDYTVTVIAVCCNFCGILASPSQVSQHWYSLGHLWTSYIQWCSDFSNRKCCAQYAETETPKRGYGQCLGYSKPTGSDDVIQSDLYFGVRIAVCTCSDRSPYSSLYLFGLQSE